jgi:hypothetical protein
MVRRIRQFGAARQAGLATAAVGAFIALAACGSQVAAGQSASTGSPDAAPTPVGRAVAGVALCRDIPQLTSVMIIHAMAFRASQPGSALPRGVAILNPGQVRDLATALCELPKMPPGPVTCPAEFGSSVRFEFAAGGRPFPPVTVHTSGCRVVTGLGPARTARSAASWGTLSENLGPSAPPATSRSGGISP